MHMPRSHTRRGARVSLGQTASHLRVAGWMQVTELGGEMSHWVDEVYVAGAGSGMQGLCGKTFAPAALITPEGRMCLLCSEMTIR